VSRGLAALSKRTGIYHLSGRGRASWFDFARAIFEGADRPRVMPITTAEYPTSARRPASAVLATAKLEEVFGIALPDWRQTLAACKGAG
jgi:dTDP-4-dehydrorhamnose reductase